MCPEVLKLGFDTDLVRKFAEPRSPYRGAMTGCFKAWSAGGKARDPTLVQRALIALLGIRNAASVQNWPATAVDVVSFIAFREVVARALPAQLRLDDDELLLIEEFKLRIAAGTMLACDVASIRDIMLKGEQSKKPQVDQGCVVKLPNPFARSAREAIARRFHRFPLSEARTLAEEASKMLMLCPKCRVVKTERRGCVEIEIENSTPYGFRCSICRSAVQGFDLVANIVRPTANHDHYTLAPCCGLISKLDDIEFTDHFPNGICSTCKPSAHRAGPADR